MKSKYALWLALAFDILAPVAFLGGLLLAGSVMGNILGVAVGVFFPAVSIRLRVGAMATMLIFNTAATTAVASRQAGERYGK